jgi:hypothetical protein
MITIHTLTYNEEVLLPFFIEHYRKNFPNCVIKIYDNESTDNTCKIAKEKNCEVISYNSSNTLSDEIYLNIKNNVWKNSNTDWNLVCDVDELCVINENDLNNEELNNTTIIKFSAYDMVNMSNDPNDINLNEISFGVRHSLYDKDLLFNKKFINEINYQPGCHKSNPIGSVKYSSNEYKMLHYKYIGENFIVKRYEHFKQRMSEKNKKRGWGYQYLTDEQVLRNLYKENQLKSSKII